MKIAIPDSLVGDGFFLRPWKIDDAAWYVNARDAEIFRWTTEKRDLTIQETENAIRHVNSDENAICLAIVDLANLSLLGNIALALEETGSGTAEIMYWLAAPARGRGIACRAVILLCRWAFQNTAIERITLKTMRGNIRSQRVAQRAGFEICQVGPGDEFVWFEIKSR